MLNLFTQHSSIGVLPIIVAEILSGLNPVPRHNRPSIIFSTAPACTGQSYRAHRHTWTEGCGASATNKVVRAQTDVLPGVLGTLPTYEE